MSEPCRPTVLVLASGRGERFAASGGQVHKLQALLHGRPVLSHTLEAVRASGLPFHVETTGLPGMGDSIAAAVRATPDADGWLVLPGDLPLVHPTSLVAVAHALRDHDVAVPCFGGQRGHPVGFAKAQRDGLLALCGDHGASPLVRAAFDAGRGLWLTLEDEGVVADIDTVDDLARAARAVRRDPPWPGTASGGKQRPTTG